MAHVCSVQVYESCSSTMDLARLWVEKQSNKANIAPHFIHAYRQNAGRGKRERVWVSEPGNFFGTLIIPFPFSLDHRGDIAFLIPLAIREALCSFDSALGVQFKWPNDFMIEKKKFGGVLLEHLEENNERSFLSIGIGINFTSHPDHIPSACLKDYMTTLPDLDDFRDLLIEKIFHYYDSWVKDGFSAIRNAWLRHAMNINEFIQFSVGKETIRGIFRTINETGGLVLIGQDGVERTFYTGEVFFDSEK